MVSEIVNGMSAGPGSNPSLKHCVVFKERHLTLTVPPRGSPSSCTNGYRRTLGVTLRWTSIQSRAE